MNIIHDINPHDIEDSIEALNQYVQDASITPLLSVLEAVKQDPTNESLLETLSETFMALGIVQGAVLTYAPYLSVILSNNIFEDEQ